MVWIQIRTDVLSVLIWIQTVCKCYQLTTNVAVDSVKSGADMVKEHYEDIKTVVVM